MCVVVTGAGNGIGEAVAHCLANDKTPMVLVDLDVEALEATLAQAQALGLDAAMVVGSVSDKETAQEAAAEAERLGGATGLSHNAGIQRYGNIGETPEETWDEVMDVNLRSGYVMAQALLPQLIASRGSLVFMASVQGLATQENVAAYTTAKHGLIGLAKSIAVDYASHGVRSNAVAPGAVRTPMLEWSVGLADDPDAVWDELAGMHPPGRIAMASEIAEVVAFLLSDKASFVTGEVIRVDGGLLSRIGGSPKK